MKGLWMLGAGMLLSFQAAAGYVNDAKITKVRVEANGKGTIALDSNINGSPACTGYYSVLSFDAGSAGGKAIMEMAQLAKEHYWSVTVEGSGACSIYPSLEDVQSLTLE
ncbi:hypothetical protein [Luteimonas aquatica]|uniref:hypothetical protein n=1 Tax=Luteimonas aquatica TaxID=450364 RepID=UPI001F57F631|nr:hypothetical protein [Luteimonas aquatica]